MPAAITLRDGDTGPLPEGIVTPQEWRLLVTVAAWAKANRVPKVTIHPWSALTKPMPGVPRVHGISVFPSEDAPTSDLARSVAIAAGSIRMEQERDSRAFRLSMPA